MDNVVKNPRIGQLHPNFHFDGVGGTQDEAKNNLVRRRLREEQKKKEANDE